MHFQFQLEKRQATATSSSSLTENVSRTSSRVVSATNSLRSSMTMSGASRTSTSRRSATSGFSRATSTSSSLPNPTPTPSSTPSYLIPLIIVLSVLLISFLAFLSLRRIRRTHPNPKYIPTPFLKKQWRKWQPPQNSWKPARHGNGNFEPIGTAAARRLGPPAPARSSTNLTGSNAREDGTGDIGTATVDRNTSVRSVMTLPAYRPNPHHNEQVLGREGERGGIDMVLEYPEDADEEERLREEEMEALYQVRVARRRENEEREERRRLRREARDRGDFVALREIQAQARESNAARAGRTVDELRAEHERIKKERTRAVSSVSYADLGVARHDGTRIRANSEESERTGLLGDAASFAASGTYHRRDRSASSVLSIDTMNSDLPSPEFPRPRAGSQSSLRRMSTADGRSEISGRAGSSPELIEHEDAAQHSPPEYDSFATNVPNAPSTHTEPPPDYTSPIVGRGEGRSLTQSHLSTSESRNISPDSRVGSPVRHFGTGLLSENAGRSNRSSTRGVGGVPQLPSLRLSTLPSIQVDPGSPIVGREAERPPR